MAKGFKTGGRKKGVRNKATVNSIEKLKETGLTPLEYLTSIYQDPNQLDIVRIDAAKAAAPYVHAKLAQIEHSGHLKHEVSHEDALKELERAANMVSDSALPAITHVHHGQPN